MKIGDGVFHPDFGEGRLASLDIRSSRERAEVDFGFMKKWFSCEDLEPLLVPIQPALDPLEPASTGVPVAPRNHSIPGPPPLSSGSAVSHDSVDLSEDAIDARRGITALRLGQVLTSQVIRLSVGTESLQKTLNESLDNAIRCRPSFLLIDGAWGRGKTHTLSLLAAIARDRGMAIADTVMDGSDSRLSEPMKLMEALLRSLRLPGEAASDGLGQLLSRAKDSRHLPVLRQLGADEIVDVLEVLPRILFDDPDALRSVEDYVSLSLSVSDFKNTLRRLGHQVPHALRALKVRGINERPVQFATLLRNWALLVSVLGSKGLLVILDEMDVEYALTAGFDARAIQAKQRRHALFEALHSLASTAAPTPLLIAFGSAPAGDDAPLEDDAVEDIRAQLPSGLRYAKAVDPSPDDLRALLVRLTVLYKAGYPGAQAELPDESLEPLFAALMHRHQLSPNAVPRQFVRLAIEVFDLLALRSSSFDEVLHLLRDSR